MQPDGIRVLLVDDHAIARNGVRLMLETSRDVLVTGEAGAADGALQLLQGQEFDVALVDITLPGMNGLELLGVMRAQRPRMAVLVLSAYAEEIYALRALRLGAAGYLGKDTSTALLLDAVRKAATGRMHISFTLVQKLAQLAGHTESSHDALSDRELEVFRLIVMGEPLVRIGERLHLSAHTVTTYRSRILEKMGMATNAELIRYALEQRMI